MATDAADKTLVKQQMEAGMKSALDAVSTSLRRLVGSHDENLEHIGDDAVIC